MTPAPSVQLLIPGAADDTAAAIGQWLQHLSAERGLSPKTLEAYGRDARVFLTFLAGHLGGPVSLGALDGLQPRDVRGFMARRRGDGLDGRSIARALAAVRSFARFLEREGRGRMAAFAA
ncbi:MAG: site-specific integrase, partial [Phreatobacter sp.]|nr:site-specific integrase [Phreatobacter sp.]